MNEIKNKIMMDLTKVVVHCQTEELAKKVLKKAHCMGYEWRSCQSFLDETYWGKHKKNTCYWMEEGEFGKLQFYQERKFKIISAEEFLKEPVKVYYRCNEERGEEIIKALESIGGCNNESLAGTNEGLFYVINNKGVIIAFGESDYWLQQAGYTEAFLPTEETITIEGKSFTLSAIKKALGL